jgi:hypothetical protein
VCFPIAPTISLLHLHHARATRKKKSADNFPEINHSRKNEIQDVRIVWRSIFFVLVSHAAIKKTDCTNAGAMLLISAIVGFAT